MATSLVVGQTFGDKRRKVLLLALLLSSERTIPLKGEIAFTLPSDVLGMTLLYTCLNRKQTKNSSRVGIVPALFHQLPAYFRADDLMASSYRYAERTSA